MRVKDMLPWCQVPTQGGASTKAAGLGFGVVHEV